jgi:hypothetical protein
VARQPYVDVPTEQLPLLAAGRGTAMALTAEVALGS